MKRRKGKAYRPREVKAAAGISVLARARVVQDVSPLDASKMQDLALGYSGALQQVMQGIGNDVDHATLSLAANVAMLLCEQGIGAEYLQLARDAQLCCVAMGARGYKTGKYGLTGPEIRTLQLLIELHDAQLASPGCTQSMLVQVLTEMRRRVQVGEVFEAVAA